MITLAHARRQRLAPVALLGRGIEHGEMLGILVHERAAELKRGSRHTFLFKANHKRATASELRTMRVAAAAK
jgi:hypothetical protein